MANTSCEDAAGELLGYCLRGERWPPELLKGLLDRDCSRELFRVVVEGLSDRFEPRLCDVYAELFSDVLGSQDLLARYDKIRRPRPFADRVVDRVYVLSRVTLGADVAITSVILDAAKRRFPGAMIFLVGSRKAWELFEADARIGHLPVDYPRSGSLRERLTAWHALHDALATPRSIVIDPDSRLTQLGLAPVCAEEDYYFFESRAYGGDGDESLGALTRRWVKETFGQEGRAYIAPKPALGAPDDVTISLGVGGNPAKRIADPFEAELLRAIVERGARVLIDKGTGAEEARRVEAAIRGLPGTVQVWDGPFAPFAARIARSKLYIGYDSAGQHVAAACGIPLVSIFAGYPTPRMFTRWRPTGPGPIEVIRVENPDPKEVLELTLRAMIRLTMNGPNMA